MRLFLASLAGVLGLASAFCSSRAQFQVVPQPTGGYCAFLSGYLAPDEVRPQLLFASAEATLAAGKRYFRLTTVIRGSYPLPPMNPKDQTSGNQEGTMCFEALGSREEGPNVYDAVDVVRKASPELRRNLSAGASRMFEALSRPAPGA